MTMRWPDGAPCAVVLTHDVDRVRKQPYHYLAHAVGGRRGGSPLRQLRSLGLRLCGDEPYWNFEALTRLEAAYGVRSTFLFLNESARGIGPAFWGRYDITSPKVTGMIRQLDAGGWDIGLHGSYYSYRDRKLLAHEKNVLEHILGRQVVSTRQHYLNHEAATTFAMQAELGLRVDSTIGYADRPWDCARGVHPYRIGGTQLVELPITVMDTVGLHRSEMRRLAQDAIEQVGRAGGAVVLDWHQCTFNEVEYPAHVAFYRETLEWARSIGAWFATMRAIGEYWDSGHAADGA